MVLANFDQVEQSFISNLDRGEQALAAAETDYELMRVRNAARAAKIVADAMGRRTLVRRFSVLVHRAERAIAQSHPPLTTVERGAASLAGKFGRESMISNQVRNQRVALEEAGVNSAMLSSIRKAHAYISDEQFEELANAVTDEPLTRAALIALGKEAQKEAKAAEREARRREALREAEERGDQRPSINGSGEGLVEVAAVGGHSRVVFCDSLDPDSGLPALSDGSIALTFTSPPYWTFAEYAGVGVGYEGGYKDYLVSLNAVFEMVWRKTMPGGRVVVNISNMKSKREEEDAAFVYPIVSDLTWMMTDLGFTFFDEIIWHKMSANAGALGGSPLWGSYPYPPTPKILDSTFENILVFSKPGRREADLGVKEQSRLTVEDWREYTKGVWAISADRDPNHPATFPMEVADRIVRMYSFVNDVVLDPFAGTGTAIISAERNRRAGMGFEISPKYRAAVQQKAEQWLTSSTTG